jgi:hypothetical protein
MAGRTYKLDLSGKILSAKPMNRQDTPKGAIASWTAAVICRFQACHSFQKRQRTGALQNLAGIRRPVRGRKVFKIVEANFGVNKQKSLIAL